jgi:drug/metabolite transporter (DMT)-like permease
MRFTIALPILFAVTLITNGLGAFTVYRIADVPNLIGLAIVPGLCAILLYYRALRSTPASLATLAEAAFPLTVTLLLALPPPYGFSQQILPLQLGGAALFIALMIFLNASKETTVADGLFRVGLVPRTADPESHYA